MTRAMELLRRFCEEYKADGVVDIILQACHTYNVESRSVKLDMQALGVPYASIETDYSQGDAGQLATEPKDSPVRSSVKLAKALRMEINWLCLERSGSMSLERDSRDCVLMRVAAAIMSSKEESGARTTW